MIYIAANSVKYKLLLKGINHKYLSLEELIERLTFSYSKEAIYYVMKHLNVKYEVALVYLESLKYIETYHHKLSFLCDLKTQLESLNLLTYDPYFLEYIKNKKLIFLNYSYIPKFILPKIPHYQIKTPKLKQKEYQVYQFQTMEEEVSFVADKIALLIESGVDINKIKIIAGSDYYYLLSKIFAFYHIPINIPYQIPLYHTNLGKEVLANLDFPEYINQISDPKIISILNQYLWVDNFADVREMIEYDLKHQYKDNITYQDAVNIESLENNFFDDDEYVFLLGFNESSYPKIFQDNDYLSDNIKKQIGLETSYQLNEIYHQALILSLSNISNLIISYKLTTPFARFYPSVLVNEFQMEVITDVKQSYLYSHLYNKLLLSKYFDELMKYNYYHPDLDKLFTTYPEINYLTYDNQFTGISSNLLKQYLNNHISLSYTALDKYYKCGFMYYLSYILDLDIKEDTFALYLGDLFHHILKDAFCDHFDFEKAYENFLENARLLSNKEKFLLKKLKVELQKAIAIIKEQNEYIEFKKALYEEKVVINLDKYTTFSGIIDKIYYHEVDGETYLAVVDYKTGQINSNIDTIQYGLNLQLPLYLYLAKKIEKFKDPKIYGFYLQPLLFNEQKTQDNKTQLQLKKRAMRLQGYSLDKSNVEFVLLDDKSKIIHGLKQKKDGSYYHYAKVLTEKEIEDVAKIAEKKIKTAAQNILSGSFPINPKIIDNKNISCEYCKFSDICFVREKDYQWLQKPKSIIGDMDEMDN